MKQTIQVEIDVPEGFELTGEYREVEDGEYFFTTGNTVRSSEYATIYSHFILRKKEWEPKIDEEYFRIKLVNNSGRFMYSVQECLRGSKSSLEEKIWKTREEATQYLLDHSEEFKELETLSKKLLARNNKD